MLTNNEKTVLGFLRENARSSVSKIAERTDIPVTSVFNILKKLEDKKIIKKYTTLLDYSKLMFHVQVNFAVSAKKKKELLEYLVAHHNVNSVFRAGNGIDYYFETVFHDMAELYDFIESLDGFELNSIHEHHLIEDIAREKLFLRDDEFIFYPEHMKNEII